MPYISYKDIAQKLDLTKSSIIMLTSDMYKIAYNAIEHNEDFNLNIFIDTIIERLDKNSTLVIPTYNWGFCSGKPFVYNKTSSKTGALGNTALKRNDFKRTKHPIYSFAVWGKDQDYLCSLNNTFAFDENSVFHYLATNHAVNLVIDTHFNDHYTFCHYIEQILGVPYRYSKFFRADYTDEFGKTSKKTYQMSVRYIEKDVQGDAQVLYEELKKQGIVEIQHINDSVIEYIDIYKSIDVIKKDILENNAYAQVQYKGQFDKIKDKGSKIYNIMQDLFPITRSLSGEGNRQTLNYLKDNHIGELNIKEYSSNQTTFDWNTPPEWNVEEAYIEDENGNKIIDFKNNNLHLLGYSLPIDAVIPFHELDNNLYSLEDDVDAIPYVTSYYKERWGFCLTHNMRCELRKEPDKKYHVVIKSSLNKNGVINYGELIINGQSEEEILLSTYICHPSLANDNLSGTAVLTEAAKYIYRLDNRRYTYRILFIPETIGALIYLKENMKHMQAYTKAGFVLSCLGDDGDYSRVLSPYNNTYTDKIAHHVLKYITDNPKEYSFLERGSDERQFCAPLVDLPVNTLCRTKFGEFQEYHTSKDNLDFVSAKGLEGGYNLITKCIYALENDFIYKINTIGEPQLGKYGLYPTISHKGSASNARHITNIIAYLNGKNSLLDISNILNINIEEVIAVVEKLKNNNLVTKI